MVRVFSRPPLPFFCVLSCISQDRLSAPWPIVWPRFAASRRSSGSWLRLATSPLSIFLRQPLVQIFNGGEFLQPRENPTCAQVLRSADVIEGPVIDWDAYHADRPECLPDFHCGIQLQAVAGSCRQLQADSPGPVRVQYGCLMLQAVAGSCRQSKFDWQFDCSCRRSEMTGNLTAVAGGPK